MTNKRRRQFLRLSSALLASTALPACGGGGKVPVPSKTLAPPVPPPAAPNPGPGIAGVPIANARFTLRSSTTQQAAPFCLGYAFRRGDVPAGRSVGSNIGTLQVTPKNVWPDGSLKFAVLAGQIDVPAGAGTTVALQLRNATAPSAGLGTAHLRSTGIVAEIGCGTFGVARWEGAAWDTPFQSWVTGPSMSSWIYRKPVGADPHLVAWLEVRLWANGTVEVLPWIENGFLRVGAPTNKSANYSFSLGGKVRMSAPIDLKHHQRTPLISGTALSYWLGNDPQITLQHDKPYLQATELVPSYMAQIETNAPALQTLAATFQPLQAGNFNYDSDAMASPGYQDPIGLLPRHDVLYVVSDADIAYAAVVRNGFSAGRYGIHYRDETTQRPIRFSSYPTLNIGTGQGFKDTGGSTTNSYTPTPSGGNPPGWDVAHSPSVGFMAYLITGRWYFMEEVQFAATANYLGNGDNAALRTGSKGLVQSAVGAWQTRSCAWDWRTRVQALCVTPDDDPLRSEFIASVEANIEHFHSRYVAKQNNPYGWIKPGEGYNNTIREGSPWQQDFVTAAFGYSLSLGLPLSESGAAKLSAFFQWKAKSAVMRLGPQGQFWYINAVPYTMMISPSTTPDYDNGTGPWYDSDAAVYAATYANPPTRMGTRDGVLAAEYLPGERALWGNLMPAIAYAVRHNVPGAQAAYGRIVAASNWGALRDAFNTNPVWSVKPALGVSTGITPLPTREMPAWMAGKPLNEWFAIPNTSGAGGAPIEEFSGWALVGTRLISPLSGGHGVSDNRVVGIDLAVGAPSWSLLNSPSAVADRVQAVPYYKDGKPISRHVRHNAQWMPSLNRVVMLGVRDYYAASPGSLPNVDGFNLDTNTWDAPGTYPDILGGASSVNGGACVDANGDGWVASCSIKFTAATKTWSAPLTAQAPKGVRYPWALDTKRGQMFGLCYGDGWGYSVHLGVCAVKQVGNVQTQITFNPSATLNQFIADVPAEAGMAYDPINDYFLFHAGAVAGRFYKVIPNNGTVWDMEIATFGPGNNIPAAAPAGIQSRLSYVPSLKGFVILPRDGSNLYFIRTA